MQHVTLIKVATGEVIKKQVKGISSDEDVASSDVGVEHVSGVTAGDDEEDNMQHVTNVVNDVHITGATGGDDSVDEEDNMKQVTVISFDEDVASSDVGVEHISGVTGGDVDNSTVVGVVKGGMRNKQTVIDSDICITGGRGLPDGDLTDADDKTKEVTGVAGGVVKDATVVGEVHGGMENEQTIENSKIYSDGGFGGNLQFLDLNIRQRDDSGEQQDGAVQIIKDCIIDLRKPDDPTDKGVKRDDADCNKDEAGSATGDSVEEPDEETEKEEMQKKIQEVKEQSEREEETRRLMQEKQAAIEEQETRRLMQEKQAAMEEQETRRHMQERQAAMEEQLQREQREREQMQAEVQRISNEQRQNAAYRGYPNPHMAAGGVVVAPGATRLAYVNPNPKKGKGLVENIQQFLNGLKNLK
ncbi:non-muscle caldesmon-like [Haliotis rufescens]|uniref:non-muscle caldesmon-like n=1 Tax=Haliotis rufescens TaxID=6454 RepID=UPI00201EE7F1|nr:non-muscle caldesmon-like [Haliotis rufescens]